MIADAMTKFREMVRNPLLTVDGRPYYDSGTRFEAMAPPLAEPLEVETLSGVTDYVTLNPDGLTSMFVHVESEDRVRVVGGIGIDSKGCAMNFERRNIYLVATCEFRWTEWMNPENFVIFVQSRFVQDDNAKAVLRVVGNIQNEESVSHEDDGVSQKVAVRQGARVVAKDVPNPIELRPYRTFPEIEQPASLFVLRIRKTDANLECALIPGDGGRWKSVAILSIKEWLASKIQCPILA